MKASEWYMSTQNFLSSAYCIFSRAPLICIKQSKGAVVEKVYHHPLQCEYNGWMGELRGIQWCKLYGIHYSPRLVTIFSPPWVSFRGVIIDRLLKSWNCFSLISSIPCIMHCIRWAHLVYADNEVKIFVSSLLWILLEKLTFWNSRCHW